MDGKLGSRLLLPKIISDPKTFSLLVVAKFGTKPFLAEINGPETRSPCIQGKLFVYIIRMKEIKLSFEK